MICHSFSHNPARSKSRDRFVYRTQFFMQCLFVSLSVYFNCSLFHFGDSHCSHCHFGDSHCSHCHFGDSHCSHCHFDDSDCSHCHFGDSHCSHCHFGDSHCNHFHLGYSHCNHFHCNHFHFYQFAWFVKLADKFLCPCNSRCHQDVMCLWKPVATLLCVQKVYCYLFKG